MPQNDGSGAPANWQRRYLADSSSPSSPTPRTQAPAWARTCLQSSCFERLDRNATSGIKRHGAKQSFEDKGMTKLELGDEAETEGHAAKQSFEDKGVTKPELGHEVDSFNAQGLAQPRFTPSAFSLDASVEGFMPSNWAAPFSPDTRPSQRPKARTKFCRSNSSSSTRV